MDQIYRFPIPLDGSSRLHLKEFSVVQSYDAIAVNGAALVRIMFMPTESLLNLFFMHIVIRD